MPVVKPNLPAVPVAQLQSRLEALRQALESGRTADGGVDLVRARRAAGADPSLQAALQTIGDAFTPRGGAAPVALDAQAATRLKGDLDRAFDTARSFDADSDGVVRWNEAPPVELGGVDERIVRGLLQPERAEAERALETWRGALKDVQHSVVARVTLDDQVRGLARYHSRTPAAEQAILWHFRDLVSQGKTVKSGEVNAWLRDAETSFWSFVPLVSHSAKTSSNHLSDAEVMKALGTGDLQGYAAQKQEAVSARLGMDFETGFLTGKDIPGADQLSDPLFGIAPPPRRPLNGFSDS